MQKRGWVAMPIIVFSLLLIGEIVVPSPSAIAADHPILYLFWGEGCPHCEKEKAFLKQLHPQYQELEMRWFELWDHPEFLKLAEALRKAYNMRGPVSVPITILGDFVNIGYLSDDTTGIDIEGQVLLCFANGCGDALEKVVDLPIVKQIRREAQQQTPQTWQLFLPAEPPEQQ